MGKRREKRLKMGVFWFFWGVGGWKARPHRDRLQKTDQRAGGGVVSGGKWKVEGRARGEQPHGRTRTNTDGHGRTRTLGTLLRSGNRSKNETFLGVEAPGNSRQLSKTGGNGRKMGKRRENERKWAFFWFFGGLGDGRPGLIETGYRKPIKGRGEGVVSGGKWKVEGRARGEQPHGRTRTNTDGHGR